MVQLPVTGRRGHARGGSSLPPRRGRLAVQSGNMPFGRPPQLLVRAAGADRGKLALPLRGPPRGNWSAQPRGPREPWGRPHPSPFKWIFAEGGQDRVRSNPASHRGRCDARGPAMPAFLSAQPPVRIQEASRASKFGRWIRRIITFRNRRCVMSCSVWSRRCFGLS